MVVAEKIRVSFKDYVTLEFDLGLVKQLDRKKKHKEIQRKELA